MFSLRVSPSGPLSTSSRMASHSPSLFLSTFATSPIWTLALGSCNGFPAAAPNAPRFHPSTSETSSATVTRASSPSADNAAARVNPIPSPPISTRGEGWSAIRSHASVASASSEPCIRLFINSPVVPAILMENSSLRCSSRSWVPLPGMVAVPISVKRAIWGSGCGSGRQFNLLAWE